LGNFQIVFDLCNRWPLYLSAVNGGKLLVEFIINEQRTSGMCNKLDKDGNHQDMLMDKPQSNMYKVTFEQYFDAHALTKMR
jgi:hypothetical protein